MRTQNRILGQDSNPAVVAYHESGHAVAGMVLGVEFTVVRIVPGRDGKIGVTPKTNPWLGSRPASNPGEFTNDEWTELSQAMRSGSVEEER